jgi:hypothetical protein
MKVSKYSRSPYHLQVQKHIEMHSQFEVNCKGRFGQPFKVPNSANLKTLELKCSNKWVQLLEIRKNKIEYWSVRFKAEPKLKVVISH